MININYCKTERLKIAYYRQGEGNGRILLLLHGNLSSSSVFLPLFPVLSEHFDVIAPDLRCFGLTETKDLDASRGFRDWADDIKAFVDTLGLEHFILGGWSMGGDIAMQYTIDHPEDVDDLLLICPGSPYGFGGSRGEEGRPLYPLGIGTGAGTANPSFIKNIINPQKGVLSYILEHYMFADPTQINEVLEECIMQSASGIKLGEDKWPGNFEPSIHWPFFSAGDKGVLNAMSPKYGNVSGLLKNKKKPDIVWIRGAADVIVSDKSLLDFGYLGSVGLIPFWPGSFIYPPQPMIAQTRYFLEQYKTRGGKYQEIVLPGGHGCFLENIQLFVPTVVSLLK